MAVSGINNYKTTLYQWQAQQLQNTGSNASSTNLASSLFGNTTSMTNQISSMIELTKYAMDAMGVGSDARVSFSQITKYRQQLQNEFTTSVKSGLANSGISNISGMIFTLTENGNIYVAGSSETDRKKAQAWLDANSSFGKELAEHLKNAGYTGDINFSLSSIGKMTVLNKQTSSLQQALNNDQEITEELRSIFEMLDINLSKPVTLSFNEDGDLITSSDNGEQINQQLKTNSGLLAKIRELLSKNSIDAASVTFTLTEKGPLQVKVNNAGINDIQTELDSLQETGKKIYMGLNNLGVDPNINFSLQVNEDGTVNVIGDHPDLARVQKFFNDNPELVKKYRQIETLAGIDDARKAMQISPTEMRKRIQIESMASWWGSSDSAASYFGNYNNGSLSLMSGLNLKV